jgi:hypothetical protein
MIRKISIPTSTQSQIVLLYKKNIDGTWSSTLSRDTMEELTKFLRGGMYQLDVKSPFIIEDIEE